MNLLNFVSEMRKTRTNETFIIYCVAIVREIPMKSPWHFTIQLQDSDLLHVLVYDAAFSRIL